MEFNEEQNNYFSYLENEIIPTLKENSNPQLELSTINLEWNLKKLRGEVEGEKIDTETYVNRTKADFQTIQNSSEDDKVNKFASDVVEKIEGFFGIVTAVKPEEVENILSQKAESNKQKLDWQKSIVDLCKLLGLDSSWSSRKAMALKLGFPEQSISKVGSAEVNTWLHSQLMSAIAQNGGELPSNVA